MEYKQKFIKRGFYNPVIKIATKISESFFWALRIRILMRAGVWWGERMNFTLSNTASDQGINGTD